jgi:hypothetical protein
VKTTWRQIESRRDDQLLSVGELLVGFKMEIDEKIDLLNSVVEATEKDGLTANRKRLSYKEVKELLDRGEKI